MISTVFLPKPVLAGVAAWACGASLGVAVAQETYERPTYPFEVSVREVWRTYGDPGFAQIRGMVQWPCVFQAMITSRTADGYHSFQGWLPPEPVEATGTEPSGRGVLDDLK